LAAPSHDPAVDPFFKVKTLTRTPNPNQVVWYAMHQDYSENFIGDEEPPEERKAAEICLRNLLAGEKGHMGPYEHPQITFSVGWFPHSVMQQGRTHRVSTSWDVQSFRYSGKRICDVIDGARELEEVFYLRPVGEYRDRNGKRYVYDKMDRDADLEHCLDSASLYTRRIKAGSPEEQARSIIPFDTRQHFVVSFNARSLMHFFDLRSKLDAQLEIRQLCELLMEEFRDWMPELAGWYEKHRYSKARLAP
jgi:thymidylate synthase (FAD)